jgi:flagellar hook-associated protein 3 FlgL
MRVTTTQTQRATLVHLQGNLKRLLTTQTQSATGRRFENASDDPAAAADILRADTRLSAYSQYTRNLDTAIARGSAEDRVLGQMANLIDRASELAIAQAGDSANPQTRGIAKVEVDQLLQGMITLGNTRFGEGFLFGGTRADQQPLSDTPLATPPYIADNAPLGDPALEIADGITAVPVHNAHEIFRDTGVMATLRDLSTALGANDAAGVTAAIDRLQQVQTEVQRLTGETGARVNQFEAARNEVAEATLDTRVTRSQVADIDIAEAVANFSQAQTAYQAALSAASRVINLNITDYLR